MDDIVASVRIVVAAIAVDEDVEAAARAALLGEEQLQLVGAARNDGEFDLRPARSRAPADARCRRNSPSLCSSSTRIDPRRV